MNIYLITIALVLVILMPIAAVFFWVLYLRLRMRAAQDEPRE